MFKNIYKRIALVVLFVCVGLFPFNLKGTSNFKLIINEETSSELHGVIHRKIIGQIELNGVQTNQIINYTAANVLTDPMLHAATGDGFIKNGFGMTNVRGQVNEANMRYFNQARVITAVNGDFHNNVETERLGIPSMTYVRDYQVIYEGAGLSSRILIGFKDNGEVIMGHPTMTGYELFVYDEDGYLKDKKVKIAAFNRLPEENEVTAFFSDGGGTIISDDKKVVLKAGDIKLGLKDQRYFAEGTFKEITEADMDVSFGEFVLMGDELFLEGFIEETDTLVVQNVLGGEFAGVKYGMGGSPMLVTNGALVTSTNKDVHPRTAVGVKADGTVFYVTVDGRNAAGGADGVDYEQLGELMLYFGAVEACNVDGGGSTTMLVYNEETNYYDTVNYPSDDLLTHRLRSVSNSMFFLYGSFAEPLPKRPYPDLREEIATPKNISFVDNRTLRFDPVENAEYYIVLVDGKERLRTETNSLVLNVGYGEHEVTVKAFGNYELYRQSKFSAAYYLKMYSNGMLELIEGLQNYAKNSNNRK